MSDSRPFELVTNYKPAGDQPQAIEKLVNGVKQGYRNQLLLGVKRKKNNPITYKDVKKNW